jgi:hypothetical protein
MLRMVSASRVARAILPVCFFSLVVKVFLCRLEIRALWRSRLRLGVGNVGGKAAVRRSATSRRIPK